MMDFHIEIKKLIEIKGFDTGDGHAQGIAKERHGVMIFDQRHVFRQDGTLFRFLDVSFERHQSFLAGFVEQVVYGLEQLKVTLLGVFRSAEYAD